MKVAIFGGSFDPVHSEHKRLVVAAVRALRLDRVLIMPSFVAPHKKDGAHASGENRLEMCRLAFEDVPQAEVSDFELRQAGTSYTYLTCRALQEKYPDAERYLLVGADMLENFFSWKNPQEIVACVTLAACGRGGELPKELHGRFTAAFGCDFVEVPFVGGEVSSSRIRVDIAFGKRGALDEKVQAYVAAHNLYTHPAIPPALALEKEERREHSYRVACMAVARVRSLGVSQEKALLAAALHDCAKYVPSDSKLLKGFTPPRDVPAPVLHQYAGAYIAEHALHVSDEEVLEAIRYHASGRAKMGLLEKLIYLADLLEEGRTFAGVEALRTLFWQDLNACFLAALRHQISYLTGSGKQVYPLTLQAYEWEISC